MTHKRNNLGKIGKMFCESGAKEVHVRIACPEIKYLDFYGVDMPTKEELLAHKKLQQMQSHKSKKPEILSLKGLYKALTNSERNSLPQFMTILPVIIQLDL